MLLLPPFSFGLRTREATVHQKHRPAIADPLSAKSADREKMPRLAEREWPSVGA